MINYYFISYLSLGQCTSYDVTLIDQWPAHVEKMRAEGITIIMPHKKDVIPIKVLHIYEVAELTDSFDIVFIVTKAYDALWSSVLIEPYLKPNGLLVAVQNGMTAEMVADVVGNHRTLGCVIEISSALYEPGIIHRNTPPEHSWFAVGSFHPDTKGRESEIVELLSHAGTCEISDDILSAKWMKLVYNSATIATTAILGLTMAEAINIPGMRDLMLRAGQEAIDVGDTLGYKRLPILGLTEKDILESNRIVETMIDCGYKNFIIDETKAGILQDWEKGRRSEAWNMNGHVVDKADNLNMNAPVSKAIINLTQRIENHELKPDPKNLTLLNDLIKSYCAETARY